MDQKDLDFFHQSLDDALQGILRQGDATIEGMTDDPKDYADPADRAAAESDRSFDLLLRTRERKLVHKIHEAIGRIEEGTYGICEGCGEDIGVPRLKARPVTTLCIKCKALQETEEKVRGA